MSSVTHGAGAGGGLVLAAAAFLALTQSMNRETALVVLAA